MSNNTGNSALLAEVLTHVVRHFQRSAKRETSRLLAGSMTRPRGSDTRKLMGNFRLSGPWSSKVVLAAALLGTANCEKSAEPENKPAASAVAAAPLDVPTAQPPKLNDQPVLAPPSLSPPDATEAAAKGTPPTDAKAAPAAPSAAAAATTAPAATTANPKAPPTTTGARPNTTTPGPMAPRTADTM